jgi:integrase
LLVVAEWLRDGIPDPKRKGTRPISSIFELHTVLSALRALPLSTADAEKVLGILRDRQLIETAVVRAGPGSDPLVSFLERFWDFDKSQYVREKLAHEQRIGRRHCYEMALWIRKYWKPYFGEERRLVEIRKADLQTFALWLKETKGQKGKTVNNCLAAGTVPLRWANANELIPSNPASGLMKFGGRAERRGVLTEEEVARLFAKPWADERAYLGNALAMRTGLRLGEVLAIQVRDIEDNRIRVRHSWSNIDRLKSTKTGEQRTVPLLPWLRTRMLDLARKNPHGVGPISFVFWSTTFADRPMDAHGLADPLREALLGLSITDEDRKDPEKLRQAAEYWRARRVSRANCIRWGAS